MAQRNAGVFVAGLTATALAVVGFFAVQAAGAPDPPTAADGPSSTASPSPSASPDADATPARKPGPPDGSGTGERVVYALEADRVWLVGANETVTRTFTVQPSTVDPLPGEYTVTSRSEQVTGSDGVPVEHVVRFAVAEGTVIGFSAAVDGSTPEPDPALQTGGIRQTRADGALMWEFATEGTKVVVVP